MLDAAQWTLTISRQTDEAVRELLADGTSDLPNDLSGFVEDAVKARIFELAVAEARRRTVDMSQDQLDALVDEAVEWARRT